MTERQDFVTMYKERYQRASAEKRAKREAEEAAAKSASQDAKDAS